MDCRAESSPQNGDGDEPAAALANAAPSPRSRPPNSSRASTPRSPKHGNANHHKWPVTVNPSPKTMDAEGSIAHCVLRIDGLPVRSMCADKSSIFLAEATSRQSHHGGLSGRLTVRDPRTGKVRNMINGNGNNIACLAVTRDGHVWSGSFDGVIRVARRGGQPLHEARAHASSVHALAEGAEAVFSVGGDFLVRAWSNGLVPLRTLRAHTSAVRCVAAPLVHADTHGYSGEAFAAGGAGVWSGGDDATLHVWSASEAAGFEHAGVLEDFRSPVRVVAAQHGRSPRVWAADAAGALKVYDARSRSLLRTAVSPDGGAPPTTCVACTAAAVWVGDESGGLTVYDGASLAKLRRLEGAHSGAVGGLAAPRLALSPPVAGHADIGRPPQSPPPKGEAIVWSHGAADGSVRGWGMSERLHDRLSRAREAVDAQHEALAMMRAMLPRAAAAATGRLEAASQRSDILTRRLLDLEVSVNVGSEVGEAHLAGGVGMPPPDPAAFAARRLSLPSPAAIELEGGDGGAPSAADERRTREYLQSVDGLNAAQMEIAHEVEEARIALRGRIDELISFAQGHAAARRRRRPSTSPPPFAVEDAAGTVLGSFAGTLHGALRPAARGAPYRA